MVIEKELWIQIAALTVGSVARSYSAHPIARLTSETERLRVGPAVGNSWLFTKLRNRIYTPSYAGAK
jgi:hypothetical protein